MKNSISFMFENLDAAMDVLKKLYEIGRKQDYVTYADLGKILSIDVVDKEIYHNYGWTNLWESKIKPVEGYISDDWVLILPKMKKIKIKKESN